MVLEDEAQAARAVADDQKRAAEARKQDRERLRKAEAEVGCQRALTASAPGRPTLTPRTPTRESLLRT